MSAQICRFFRFFFFCEEFFVISPILAFFLTSVFAWRQNHYKKTVVFGTRAKKKGRNAKFRAGLCVCVCVF